MAFLVCQDHQVDLAVGVQTAFQDWMEDQVFVIKFLAFAIYLFIMISYTKYMNNKVTKNKQAKKTYIYIIQPTLYNLYIIVI